MKKIVVLVILLFTSLTLTSCMQKKDQEDTKLSTDKVISDSTKESVQSQNNVINKSHVDVQDKVEPKSLPVEKSNNIDEQKTISSTESSIENKMNIEPNNNTTKKTAWKKFGFNKNAVNKIIGTNSSKNIKDYGNELLKLNYKSIYSVNEAIILYKKYSSIDKRVNDTLYDLFCEYIYSMRDFYYDDQLQEFYTKKYSTDDYIKNGFTFFTNEEFDELEVDTSFLYRTFEKYLSDGLKDYNKIISDEEFQASGFYIMDDALFITWNELSERIIWREEYYKKYKDTDFKEQAYSLKKFNDVYLRIYTCEIVFGNTPPYDYEYDEEIDNESKKVDKELIESYKKFMAEHSDSEYYSIIKRVYDQFEKNDFTYQDDVMNALYINIFGKRFDTY